MAGNQKRNRIAPDGGARGARGAKIANLFGNRAIGGELAFGNRQQRLPDLDLPGRPE